MEQPEEGFDNVIYMLISSWKTQACFGFDLFMKSPEVEAAIAAAVAAIRAN